MQDEADALRDAATTLFPRWQVASQPDPAMNERAAAALQQARDAYARGIEAVQLSVQRIG